MQRDSAKRLSSGNDYRLITRGTETIDQKCLDIARKRRSLELERRNVSSTPPPSIGAHIAAPTASPPDAPPAPPSGPTAQLDNNRGLCQVGNDERMEVATVSRRSAHRVDEGFQENRPRAHSQGPTEQEMHDAALIIAGIGDQIEQQYGGRMTVSTFLFIYFNL